MATEISPPTKESPDPPVNDSKLSKIESDKKRHSSSVKQKLGDSTNRWLEKNRSLVLRQTPVWAQTMTAIVLGIGSLVVVGGFLFRIDEVVTVSGQLKSIGGTVDVETPAGGRVAEVYFKDGENVNKGQLLVRFDTREAQDQKDTLIKMISVEELQLNSQMQTLDSQEKSVSSRLDVVSKRLQTKTTITSEMQTLVENGGMQRMQFLEQLDQVYELQKRVSELEEEISRIELQRAQTQLQSNKSLDQMKAKLRSVELQLQYQNVKAPVSGVVFDPQARKEGVLNPGERILSIVPQQGLYAEVFVPNKDIGFIKLNQEAKVRVDAFPFTRYGEIYGKVSQIGADALPPNESMAFYRFPIKLELSRSYLESQGVKIPLKSGMSVSTNLKLRDKRVISILSDLFVDQTDSIRSIRQQ